MTISVYEHPVGTNQPCYTLDGTNEFPGNSTHDTVCRLRRRVASSQRAGCATSTTWGMAVTQHICGTCRHFEEGGFAASGRCNHPKRQSIRMMVLVRKNELACREDWDGGLWEPLESSDPIPFPKVPRLVAEVTSGERLAEQYTDRVTSVGVAPAARSVPESARVLPQVNEQLNESTPSPERGARSNPPIERPAAVNPPQQAGPALRRDLWTDTPSTTARDERTAASRSPVLDERTSASRLGGRTESTNAQTPGPVERTESTRNLAPRSAEPSNRVVPQTTRPSPLRQEDESLSRSWGAPSSYPEDRIRQVTPRASINVPRPVETPARPDVAPRRSDATPPATPIVNNPPPRPRPTEPARSHLRDNRTRHFDAPVAESVPTRSVPSDPSLPEGRSGWTEPFETAGRSATGQPVQPPTESTAVTRSNGAPMQFSPSPQQASVPQCCGTCRDFRPAEGGERGWCNNQFAFDHRRMVQRTEVACRSTIGVWWIPSDDWWQSKADISHHGRPTPVVDELLRQLLDARSNGMKQRNNGRG